MFFGLGRHFQEKRAYLSQIGCFWDWEGIFKQNELAVCPARHFQAKRAYLSQIGCFFWAGKAFSCKTSLSESDRVFFGLGRHFQAKRAYLSQIGCFLDWEGIFQRNEPI